MTWVPDPLDASAVSDQPTRSDAMLLDAARAGNRDAFGVLWSRHSAAGRRIARAISRSDGDDLLSEAYLRIFSAVSNGKGPSGEFRPYLAVTIRNLAVSWARKRREDQLEDGQAEAIPDPRATDASVLAALDAGLTLRAFRTLPERWQEVLWFTEVDGLQPAQVADRLGITANSVAALSYRAREGLRQAWIQAHVDTAAGGSEHQWTLQRVGKNARGSLSKRAQQRFTAHLAECAACTVIADEAVDTSSRFTSVLLPVAVGVFAVTGLHAFLRAPDAASAAPTVASSIRERRRRLPKRAQAAAVAGAAVVFVGIGAAVGFASSNEPVRQIPTNAAVSASPDAAAAAPQKRAQPLTSPQPTDPASSPDRPSRPTSQAAPRASETPLIAPDAPAPSVSQPTQSQASLPQITTVDTGGGVLYPIVHGTAQAGEVVTVVIGDTTATVQAAPDGTWATGELTVPAGLMAATASTEDGSSGSVHASLTAPIVSVSSSSAGATVVVHGAPGVRYQVSADDRSIGMRTADMAGNATLTTATAVRTVDVHAVDADRTGPSTTINAR
jgi:RNA polymerase sigma factor (sigma-70 family)